MPKRRKQMKCSVFIATSVDGFIAKKDGNLDWLMSAGNSEIDLGDEDMGFKAHMASVDCLIMGRKCMQVIDEMSLTPEQWPYGNARIIVLSNTLKEAPVGLNNKVEIYSGSITALIETLENEGYQHAYVDGGITIQAFINLELINEMTITRAPILLGEGIPLFGKTSTDINFKKSRVTAYKNDFIQEHYQVSYG